VLLGDGVLVECVLKGRRLQIACGDQVQVRVAHRGGVLVAAEPRRNLVYRSDAFKEKLIGANVSLVVGVVAPDLPADFELIERWTIAAEIERCRFLLVANKADLPGFDALLGKLAPYTRLGYRVLPLAAKRDASALRPHLVGQHSVLVGQSGMGKSTILNALAPAAAARVGDISRALETGRHTTTETTLHLVPDDPAGGWIIDSPGMNAFSLAHAAPDELAAAFVEMRPLLGHCRFRDCRHDSEPDCAVREAVARGEIAPHRLALLQAMRAESEAARDPARSR
jgi:ribosome biogenesis GTPase / thiamine phosphate phosphatase